MNNDTKEPEVETGTTELVETAEATAEIIPLPNPPADLVVVASKPEEMRVAQANLITWFEGRIEAEKAQLSECQDNLAIAKKMKVRTQGWTRQVALSEKRIVFYEKGLSALKEGYCIVPDFPVTVIAIRTKRKHPTRHHKRYGDVSKAEPMELPEGTGHYVSSRMKTDSRTHTDAQGTRHTDSWATDFRAVDFPFKLVKPQILESLDHAMKQRIFDEIGILPQVSMGKAVSGRTSIPDPILVGRVKRRINGWQWKTLTFLISWWIDTRTL